MSHPMLGINTRVFRPATPITFLAAILPSVSTLQAHDFTDWFSVGGVVAAGGQYQSLSGAFAPVDTGRGALPMQLEFSLHPDDCNEFIAKVGLAGGNGLNATSPFVLAPWAADLEDDVKDINGRGRNYLLTAYYRHVFEFGDHALAINAGILDSTDYLDGNEFANDEYTQFMNEMFVNSGSYGLPSYDYGVAIEWSHGAWSVNALAMAIGENDIGNSFVFWGLQAGYELESSLGNGNYRLILAGTSSDFSDPGGISHAHHLCAGLSVDQEIGEHFGVFARFGWHNEDALVDYKAFYTGGINLAGTAWGRSLDNVGVGYAWLPGGNSGIEHTHACEIYYRFGITEALAVTADLQYMNDVIAGGPNTSGWISGLRAAFSF